MSSDRETRRNRKLQWVATGVILLLLVSGVVLYAVGARPLAQTLFGGGLALGGGVIVAALQSSRTEEVAARISLRERQALREEEALITLKPTLPQTGAIDELKLAAEDGDPSQMAQAWSRISDGVPGMRHVWNDKAEPVVRDTEIRADISHVLNLQTWFDRRLIQRQSLSGEPVVPEDVDNPESFQRALIPMVESLSRLKVLVEEKLIN